MPDETASKPACDQALKSEKTAEAPARTWRMDTKSYLTCALLAGVILGFAGWHNATHLKFKADLGSLVPGLLGSFFFVSLLVERVVEVFLSVWSDREVAVHEQNRDYWRSRKAQLEQKIKDLIVERDAVTPPSAERKAEIEAALPVKRAAVDLAETNIDIEEKALLPFEARTKAIAIWVGLVVGTLTSAVGFRFLAEIVDHTASGISEVQHKWFVTADILLTGAVLSGGSKLIHRIFSLYDSFMQTTKKSLSSRPG